MNRNMDDYDEDGNNIVPCPLCMEIHYDDYCPEEERMQKDPEYAKKFFSRDNETNHD